MIVKATLAGLAVVILLGAFIASVVNPVLSFFSDPGSGAVCAQSPGCFLVYAAETLEQHLEGSDLNQYATTGGARDDPPVDPFFRPIWDYLKQVCGGSVCKNMASGNFQCVSFIKAAFYLAHMQLEDHPDAYRWWTDYAQKPGWEEIPANDSPPGKRGLPAPGDLVVWSGGKDGLGHIAIVVGVQPPSATGKPGWVAVAHANSPRGDPFYTMTLRADLSLVTWSGYDVKGYIRLLRWPNLLPNNLPPTSDPNEQYAGKAVFDASAVGIPPAWYAEQIERESGYNPKALSPAGAEGIAQFMPATAAGQGIDPWNPVQSLQGAALLMMGYVKRFDGDYAAALATYNAGEVPVDQCKRARSATWLACMSPPVRDYVVEILFYALPPMVMP